MNDTTRESQEALAAVERVQRLFATQRAASLAQPFPEAADRAARLKALTRQLRRYQDLLADHGEEGLRERSHARTVLQRRRWFPTQLFHPPYGSFVQRLAMRFFLGEGDPALGGKSPH